MGFEYVSDYPEGLSINNNWGFHFESFETGVFLIWLLFYLSI